MIYNRLDSFIDTIQSNTLKHGIQSALPEAAAGRSRILITCIENYAKAADAELDQFLTPLQQETPADISMQPITFSPEELRVAERPG